jgi:hypothetical protein
MPGLWSQTSVANVWLRTNSYIPFQRRSRSLPFFSTIDVIGTSCCARCLPFAPAPVSFLAQNVLITSCCANVSDFTHSYMPFQLYQTQYSLYLVKLFKFITSTIEYLLFLFSTILNRKHNCWHWNKHNEAFSTIPA